MSRQEQDWLSPLHAELVEACQLKRVRTWKATNLPLDEAACEELVEAVFVRDYWPLFDTAVV